MNRKTLSSLILALFAVLILAFMFVLLKFSGGMSQNTKLASSDQDKFEHIAFGQTVLQRIAGKRLWLSRLSESQRQQSHAVERYLIDPTSGCSLATELCALDASTNRAGIEIRFTQSAPPQLSSGTVWYGGFVDPNSSAVYDLLGRAYRLRNAQQRTDKAPLESVAMSVAKLD